MYSVHGFKRSLRAQGTNRVDKSWKEMEAVVEALQKEGSIYEIEVLKGEEGVPLDLFLSQCERITEADTYFTGAAQFNIWTHFPMLLSPNYSHYAKVGLDHETAQKLLRRFKAYTWTEHRHKEAEMYNGYLSRANLIKKIWWGEGGANPKITTSIKKMQTHPELSEFFDDAIREKTEMLVEIEKEIDKAPPERFVDWINPFGGWQRQCLRERVLREWAPKYEEAIEASIPIVRSLGEKYRREHIERFYPDLV